jgi:aldehyde:ferredoxin oxidoreductase
VDLILFEEDLASYSTIHISDDYVTEGRKMEREYGRILIVDLKNERSRTMQIGPEVLKRFIGGAGLAAFLYRQFANKDVPPLAPASPLMIMTGPLTGTPVTLSGRHGVAGRSPLTGFWGEASVGGHWGREFRKTGFDGLVLLERTDKPIYLVLKNEKLEFRDAVSIWGKDCIETDQALKKEWGDRVQVCSIGPAGEKMVRFAGVFTDGVHARAAARCGLGALI